MLSDSQIAGWRLLAQTASTGSFAQFSKFTNKVGVGRQPNLRSPCSFEGLSVRRKCVRLTPFFKRSIKVVNPSMMYWYFWGVNEPPGVESRKSLEIHAKACGYGKAARGAATAYAL